MMEKRKVEIFSAGCPVCEQTVNLIGDIVCASCEITVLDMHDPEVSNRARQLNIQSIPVVVLDGSLPYVVTREDRGRKH